jgi:hypothetical protein
MLLPILAKCCSVRYLRTRGRTAARPSLERAGWRAVGVLPLSLGDVAQHSAIVCRVGEAACMQALEMSCDDASVLLGNNACLLVLLITFPLALSQGASAVAIFQLGVAFIATESITPYVPFRTRC